MTNANNIEQFQYLWEPSSAWVLFHLNAEKPSEEPRYTIVNLETQEILIIEDDIIYMKVKKIMQEQGNKIITSWQIA